MLSLVPSHSDLSGPHPKEKPIMNISPKAGKPAEPAILIDVPKLVDAYYAGRPDPVWSKYSSHDFASA